MSKIFVVYIYGFFERISIKRSFESRLSEMGFVNTSIQAWVEKISVARFTCRGKARINNDWFHSDFTPEFTPKFTPEFTFEFEITDASEKQKRIKNYRKLCTKCTKSDKNGWGSWIRTNEVTESEVGRNIKKQRKINQKHSKIADFWTLPHKFPHKLSCCIISVD